MVSYASGTSEGFEGTDLAALSHLERPVLPEASWASVRLVQPSESKNRLIFSFLHIALRLCKQAFNADCYIQKKVEIDISTHFCFTRFPELSACGERGIRTPGASQLNGFQDRRNRPLCHLSSSECACRMNDACQRPWATAIPPLSSKPRASRMMFFRNRVQKYCFFFKYTNFL